MEVWNISDFLHKLKDCFRKNLVFRFLNQKGQKWVQNEVYQILWKIDTKKIYFFA